MAKGSRELNHSGGSLKSNQSKAELTDFNTDSPLSGSDFSSSEEEHVVADDEDWAKSSYSLMARRSPESIDSGVSLTCDRSNRRLIHFKDSHSQWAKVFFLRGGACCGR